MFLKVNYFCPAQMTSSLRLWLISSFSTVLLICLIAIWLFINSINTSKRLEDYHSVLKTTRILLLETNKLKEDILVGDLRDTGFYNPIVSNSEKKFIELNKGIGKNISFLQRSEITINNGLLEKTNDIKYKLKEYNRNYNELIYLYKLKGFKDYGLEGKMRNYAHAIFNYDNLQTQFQCLLLRKHEKDFLLRKDWNYVKSFSAVVKTFMEVINQQTSMSGVDKSIMINNLYYYDKYFKLLARIENKIGIKGQNGYLNKSKEIFDNIALRIELLDNDLKIIKELHKERLERNTVIVVFILVVFLITVIVILTQLITRSVKAISASFSNYINSGFLYESISYKKSNIKEFNSINVSFLKMAKEINIFTNFFREKVHERTLAINQQKDEILSQQLQIEDQYQVLLAKNTELNEQKQLLDLRNEDIQQSLRYAKRIQKAIQPSASKLKECFRDSFVFSRAKDIISGDFFLVYKDPYKTIENGDTKITFVTADCTGHGIPGAMMSVLGINTINKIIKELKQSDPGKILNTLDKDVNQLLAHGKKTPDIVADGMDIAVCCFNRDTYVLDYSIAKFSHYLVRRSEVIDLTTQKSSIGYSFFNNNVKNFETYSIQLQTGDCLYLFSDGFSDQFGGSANKKYKKKNMKTLIGKIHHLPMQEQKLIFRKEFNAWKKNLAQVDDVLVMGIRF